MSLSDVFIENQIVAAVRSGEPVERLLEGLTDGQLEEISAMLLTAQVAISRTKIKRNDEEE